MFIEQYVMSSDINSVDEKYDQTIRNELIIHYNDHSVCEPFFFN